VADMILAYANIGFKTAWRDVRSDKARIYQIIKAVTLDEVACFVTHTNSIPVNKVKFKGRHLLQ
jgi:hypothetical protein